MAGQRTLGAANWLRLARGIDPPRAAWRLLTNVRWAAALLAFLALVSFLGVVLPQLPAGIRGDPAAEARWVEFQEGKFGPLTDVMHRLGLFAVFYSRWFAVTLGLTVASTAAYIVGRLPAIWRTALRPRKRVSDSFFRRARHRLELPGPLAPEALAAVLRRQRYAVETFVEGETTYLFADRFQWAQLGTLLSHAAAIVFIVAAVVSQTSGFSNSLFLAEGATLPVFPLTSEDQMQVQLLDARARFDPEGQPLDYRSQLVVYRNGVEVRRCTATVNSPCTYGGYRFHQAAYFGFGAEVEVRDLAGDRLIYRETLSLSDTMPSPRVTIRDEGGRVLFGGSLVLTDPLVAPGLTYYGTLLTLPDGRVLTVGAQREGGPWRLTVLEPGGAERGARLLLAEGETGRSGGLEVTFAGLTSLPAAFVPDLPLPPGVPAGPEGSGQALLQMSNVVYGTATASEGRPPAEPAAADGPPRLTIVGLRPQAVGLDPGEGAEISGYRYTFVGQREFAGLQVKKDRSDILIWVAAGMLLLGLVITFWVPRRRLWAKMTPARTSLAGQAAHPVDYRREMQGLARGAGASVEEMEETE